MQYRFNSKLINLLSPVFNHLKQIGISTSYIEENITYNPNTKYYLSRNKYKNNIDMYPNLPEYPLVSKASGISIVEEIPQKSNNPIKLILTLPSRKYLVIQKPDPVNYPYYFDFLDIPKETQEDIPKETQEDRDNQSHSTSSNQQ